MPRIFPALAAFLALPSISQAVVLYTENFGNTNTSGRNFNTVGWSAHTGATAIDRTTTSAVGSTDPAVIWYTAGIGGTTGYGFGALGASGVALYSTTEPGPVALSTITSLNVFSNNTSTAAGIRFAIRLDNNTPGDTSDDFWVISSQVFNSTASGTSGNWATNSAEEVLAFNTSAATWTNLAFTSGSSLVAGSTPRTTDLPEGNVTAFGIYAAGGTVRFDAFSVNVVPEPSAALLFSGALASLCLRRRR